MKISTLIIKGDETAAFTACRRHGVEITSIAKHSVFDETIVTVLGNSDPGTMARWFGEHVTAPLPSGGLLWYSPVRLDPVAYPPVPGWDEIEGGCTNA